MNSVNAVEMARVAQESGASAVAVHGRTRSQYYSGEADWDIIREVKAAVHIPVIGNGDVFHADDADRMIAYTGCDGVMISRAWKSVAVCQYFTLSQNRGDFGKTRHIHCDRHDSQTYKNADGI